MLAVRASLLAVFALIALALLLTWSAARAQEPGTTLHPGLNLVGWTAEPTSVSQLFREIPQLEAIWAWDAELRDWITAARDAPEWLGGLGRVQAGMGLRMQLGGDQPFNWQRSTEPTRGLVKLRTGWNLVAWSGADQTPIDDALKGIGWSLRAVHRWNPTNQQWNTWTSPERTAQLIAVNSTDQAAPNSEAEAVADGEAETPAIRRGEALWINVARAVNWLQPTGILPRLVFPGGASTALQARVRRDLKATLAFFRDQYGIQADPDFTVYAARNADALIQAYKDDDYEVDGAWEASIRDLWDDEYAGWASDRRIVVKQSTSDRYVLTHEYFHVIQFQMSYYHVVPQWLVEGTAEWAEGEHEVLDRKRTWTALRNERLRTLTNGAPSLRSVERQNAWWEYDLGYLAVSQLIANAGSDSWIEFWRHPAVTGISPSSQWISTPWQTAFLGAFGQTVSEFYEAFNAWQNKQPKRTANVRSIRGRVTDESGASVAGVFVDAINLEGQAGAGRHQRAETDDRGAFAIQVPENGDYRLSVDLSNGCTLCYNNGKLIKCPLSPHQISSVEVSRPIVRGIDMQLPPTMCGQHIGGHVVGHIRGRVVGPNAKPLSDVAVAAYLHPSTRNYTVGRTALDGSFALPILQSGRYRLRLHLTEHCRPYYSPSWATYVRRPSRSALTYDLSNWVTYANLVPSRSLITFDGADVNDIAIEVPEGLCERWITGAITGPGGAPFQQIRITGGWGDEDPWMHSVGRFAISVPADGEYGLSLNLENGCTVYVNGDGLTTRPWEYSRVRVMGQGAHLGLLQIPTGICRQITGRFAAPGVLPFAEVTVCRWIGSTCEWQQSPRVNNDGSFAITVPADSSYSLNVWIWTREFYFSSSGFATDPEERPIVRVEDRDVHLGTLQVPAS